MFLPITIDPRDLVHLKTDLGLFPSEQPVDCICGKKTTLGAVRLVWTHRSGTTDFGWWAACSPMCVFIHCSAGEC